MNNNRIVKLYILGFSSVGGNDEGKRAERKTKTLEKKLLELLLEGEQLENDVAHH